MPANFPYHEYHCFCRYKPLLCVYGVNAEGRLYVHIRVFKGPRIYGEVFIEDGTVRMRCRDCARWHKIIITQPGKAEGTVEEASDNLPVPAPRASHG